MSRRRSRWPPAVAVVAASPRRRRAFDRHRVDRRAGVGLRVVSPIHAGADREPPPRGLHLAGHALDRDLRHRRQRYDGDEPDGHHVYRWPDRRRLRLNPGNYNPSIAVTSSNTGGAFSLILDGTASGTTATVASPNDQAVLAYNGSGTSTVSTTVTVLAPAIGIGIDAFGTQATCKTSGVTFPQSPIGGPTVNETCTIALSGGTGTYAYYFGVSGSTTSVYAHVVQAGNLLTITPTGSGNDVLVIQSGSQTAIYTITTGLPFAASLPAAAGLLTISSIGKNYSLTLPASVVSVTQTSGPTLGSLITPPASPGSLSADPAIAGHGNFLMADATGDTGNVPFTVFGISFATYPGPGAALPTETVNAPGADEAFTGNGETDSVTVAGLGGNLSAVSSKPNLVGVTVNGNTSLTVTSAASGNGFATIPLASHARH